MAVFKVTDKAAIAPLFAGWDETFVWSCLQDCMGDAYADDLQNPQSAKIILGDIVFFAGAAHRELIRHKPEGGSEFVILVPRDKPWEEEIEAAFGEKAKRHIRYATKKEKDAFRKEELEQIVSRLPGEYELRQIDESLYRQSLALPWAQDLCGNYPDYESYRINGLGIVILKTGEIVSGASSYAYFHGGIEVEIDTRKDERRKGLALICGAKLILTCLEKGLYPSWDAHTKASLTLAQKLGYRFDKEYPTYEIRAK